MANANFTNTQLNNIVIIGTKLESGRYKLRLGDVKIVFHDFIVCEIIDHYGDKTGETEIIHFTEYYVEYNPSANVAVQVSFVTNDGGHAATLQDILRYPPSMKKISSCKIPRYIQVAGWVGFLSLISVVVVILKNLL